MNQQENSKSFLKSLPFYDERVDLAAAFRWTARLNMHEAVANHYSLSVNDDGSKFLINANQIHFSKVKASNLLLLDANDKKTLSRSDAPDPTAWGLHSSLHRLCPHARCAMHVHSTYATVLASLADSTLPPIEQNSAMFFGRYVIDDNYGGLAFEKEGERCAALFSDPKKRVMIMGNHGILVIGETVAETFNTLYYFEKAAEVYIKALQTGQKLRILPEKIAKRTAAQIDNFPEQGEKHLAAIKQLLDDEGEDYAE